MNFTILVGIAVGAFTGILGAVITGALSYRIALKQMKHQRIVQYNSIIVPERIQWLNKLRNTFGDIINSSYDLGNKCLDSDVPDHEIADAISTVRNYANLAVLMISPSSKAFEKKIDDFVQNIENKSDVKYRSSHRNEIHSVNDIAIQHLIILFRSECQIFLKEQWERIENNRDDN